MAQEIDYQDYQRALQFDQRFSRVAALQSLTRILIDELNPQPTDRVLDAGTGTGRLAMILHNLVPQGFIAGVDSGSGMLRVAREKIQKDMVSNFHIIQGRAEDLPFSFQAFDSACLMLSFHHFTFPERAVEEIYRTLKAGGHLVSVDPVLQEASDEEDQRLNESIEEAFQLAHGPQFRFLTMQQLRHLFKGAGFSIENDQAFDFTFEQRGIDGIPMGPHWLQACEMLRFRREESLVKKFEKQYLAFREKEGQLLVKGKMSWAAIKAVKE